MADIPTNYENYYTKRDLQNKNTHWMAISKICLKQYQKCEVWIHANLQDYESMI